LLPVKSNISMHQYECVVLYKAISAQEDWFPHLLPPAAPCQKRAGHQWCSWARWSTVAWVWLPLGSVAHFRVLPYSLNTQRSWLWWQHYLYVTDSWLWQWLQLQRQWQVLQQ